MGLISPGGENLLDFLQLRTFLLISMLRSLFFLPLIVSELMNWM